LLRNGVQLTSQVELSHLDRLLFGTSQYYLFVIPSKATPQDQYYTFESMQDEIGKAAGLMTKDNKNMTSDEIACQSELVDLVPAIEEANMMSISLDKKVIFSALPVSAEARGEYDGKHKAFVIVKNYLMNLEWVWPKNKFLDRKTEMSELYFDLKDGVANSEKYKKYDPFYESPDSPFQVFFSMKSISRSIIYFILNFQ
jgi:kinesin family protein 1